MPWETVQRKHYTTFLKGVSKILKPPLVSPQVCCCTALSSHKKTPAARLTSDGWTQWWSPGDDSPVRGRVVRSADPKWCVWPSQTQMRTHRWVDGETGYMEPDGQTGGWMDRPRPDRPSSSSSDRDEWIPKAEGQRKYTERSCWSSRHSAASGRCISTLNRGQRHLVAWSDNTSSGHQPNTTFLLKRVLFSIVAIWFSKNKMLQCAVSSRLNELKWCF